MKKTGNIGGDAFAACWNERLFPKKNLTSLSSPIIYDVQGNLIRTVANRKNMAYLEKRIKELKNLEGHEKKLAIQRLEKAIDSNFVGDNYYNSVRKNLVTFLKHIGTIDSEGELTDYGFKLYHLGLSNGPNSKLFRDYFTRAILLNGHHLDIIFDLDRLFNKYKGVLTFQEIRSKLESIYEVKGMIKRNPKRQAKSKSKVNFLKYEVILWNSLGLKLPSNGKPKVCFNWQKITEVCSLPPLN